MMNKFDGPDDRDFKLVRKAIQDFASMAGDTLRRRKNGKFIPFS